MRSRGWSTAVLVVLLVAATVAPVLGAAATGVASPENNTTSTPVPRHENPENRSEFGNLGMYERWLAGRMSEVLVDCTEGARARQFGACDLDSEYPDWLGKYVDVARETENEQDDETADAFEDAKEDQRTFNNEVERFWRTYEAYKEARDRGDTARARRLARRLGRLATGINETSGNLTRDYRRLTNTTQLDLTDAIPTVEDTTQNVTTVARDVESDVFVATTLTVRANATDISFLTPLAVSGRLTTENGSAIAERAVRIAVEGRTFQTRTDANGSFDLTYRPTTLPVDADRVSVRYVPRNASAYLPSAATLPVSVEQVEPTVTVLRRPPTVGFGETVVVNGSVSAGGIDAPGVPVRVSVADGPTTTVATGSDGAYRVQLTVPATVPDGDRQVRATVPLDEQALGRANATTTVTVRRTDTVLTLDGSHAGADAIRVRGRLTTVDAEPVGGQPIRITLGGTTVETVRTSEDGRYATTVTVPRRLLGDEESNATVRVAAQFEATGTNLEPARNATLVRIDREAGAADARTLLNLVEAILTELATWSVWQWALAGVGGVALLGGLALAWLKRPLVTQYLGSLFVGEGEQPTGGSAGAESDAGDASGPPTETEPGATAAEPPSPLERAHQQLEWGDTDSAVRTAYTVTRDRLATVVEPSSQATHWEFYNTARTQLAAEQHDALQRLTEAYEAAAFAPTAVGADVARAALDAAERFQGGSVAQSDGGVQSTEDGTGETSDSTDS